MKRKFSRILGLLLALVMVMSTSLAAFAMDGNEVYLSPAPGTGYTTVVDSNENEVELEVYFSAYDGSSYYKTGFDNEAQAEDVSWSVISDEDELVDGEIEAGAGSNSGYITGLGTVSLNMDVVGVAIVRASYTTSSSNPQTYTLDLVIARDANMAAAGVSADTYVVNASTSPASAIVSNQSVSVCAPSTDSTDELLKGKSAVLQNLPTAMGTLKALLAASGSGVNSVALSDDGSYVNAINDIYYWGYAVYTPSGALVDLSQNISASVLVLPANGYTVVWKCGSWTFANTLSEEIASWAASN